MKIECVLTSCNLNPLYSDFIPIFINAWSRICQEADVRIILVSSFIQEKLIQYKDKSRLSVYDVIGFKIGLEDLFRKQVDLVEDGFIYPRLVNYIQNDKVLLFFNK